MSSFPWQQIPDVVAQMPPGPELAAALFGLEPRRLPGYDLEMLLVAQQRQINALHAAQMATMLELGLRDDGPEDPVTGPARKDAPDQYSSDALRAPLGWTGQLADTQFSLAWDVQTRIPAVCAAMSEGVLDQRRAAIFSDWTMQLSDEQARIVCGRVLPEAPGLTTGRLRERLRRECIAIDPDWAARRYHEGVKDRQVVKSTNPDGSANLSGRNLPLDEAATAKATVDRLVQKAKTAGDHRRRSLIAADIYLGLLSVYRGLDDAQIVADLLDRATHEPADPDPDSAPDPDPDSAPGSGSTPAPAPGSGSGSGSIPAPSSGPGSGPGSGSTLAPGSSSSSGSGSGSGSEEQSGPPDGDTGAEESPGQRSPQPSPGPRPRSPSPRANESRGPRATPDRSPNGTAKPHPGPRPGLGMGWRLGTRPRAGVEVRIELTSMLGWDDRPAHVPGWDHIHARLARRMARVQARGEWRYAVTDDHGRLDREGVTRARPEGWLDSAPPCPGAVVELAIPRTLLKELAADPACTGVWANVITDIAAQIPDLNTDSPGRNPHDGQEPVQRDHRGRDVRRFPRIGLRRHTQIRDRRCCAPGCRAPAVVCDADHVERHADGGATSAENLQSLCRHDHALKDDGGWKARRLKDGTIRWTTRHGTLHDVEPTAIIIDLPSAHPFRGPPTNARP